MNTNTFDAFALATLLIMAVAVPLLGIWDFRRLMNWVEEGRADARTRSYNWIMVMEWGMSLGLMAWWLAVGRDFTSIGLVPAAEGWQWLAIGLGLVASVAMITQMVMVMRSPDQMEKLNKDMGDLSVLAPQTPRENRGFTMVAITAGVCEEILYRGFLMVVLAPVLGTWPAVLLTSVIFGLGHAYQGLVGMGKTALVGLVMALLTVFSGSLFVPILLHVVIDLTSGRMMSAALKQVPAPVPSS